MVLNKTHVEHEAQPNQRKLGPVDPGSTGQAHGIEPVASCTKAHTLNA